MAKTWRCYFAVLALVPTLVPALARAGGAAFPARLECAGPDGLASAPTAAPAGGAYGGSGSATEIRLVLGSRDGSVWGTLALGPDADGFAPLPLACVAVDEDRRRTDELRARCGADLPERDAKIEVEVFQGGFLQAWTARATSPGLLDAFLICAPGP